MTRQRDATDFQGELLTTLRAQENLLNAIIKQADDLAERAALLQSTITSLSERTQQSELALRHETDRLCSMETRMRCAPKHLRYPPKTPYMMGRVITEHSPDRIAWVTTTWIG